MAAIGSSFSRWQLWPKSGLMPAAIGSTSAEAASRGCHIHGRLRVISDITPGELARSIQHAIYGGSAALAMLARPTLG